MTVADYAENKLVDAITRHTTTGGGLPTANPYVKLHTSDPGDTPTTGSGGTAATETSRQQVAFAAASGGIGASSADAVWSSVAGTETISHISLWDASTAGNALGSGALTVPKSVTAGEALTIPAGSLTFQID